MKSILKTDLVIFFNSAIGYVMIFVWLLLLSTFLWIFPGEYNLPDAGYASLLSFFTITSFLLILFVPAVTMRLFAEEKRLGTLDLLFTRPVSLFSVILSKYLVGIIIMLLAILPTFVYVYSMQYMSGGALDIGEVVSGYIGIFCLVIVFCAIGVFTSTITSNQLVGFILGAILSFFFYFGFDLLASLTAQGSLSNKVADWGMHTHYNSMLKGIVDTRDLVYFLLLASLFLLFTFLKFTLQRYSRDYKLIFFSFITILLLGLFSAHFYIRWDLTEEKKYTLSIQTRELMSRMKSSPEVILYLNGDLNPSFDRLRKSVIAILEEFSQYTSGGIRVKMINPSGSGNESARQTNYRRMEQQGMPGITVNEKDRQGKISSRIVFPWMEIVYQGDTIQVGLLKNNISLSSMELLNASIDELEYKLADAIHILQIETPETIAFIEGHGEYEESSVYEAVELLSKYYDVDRGIINGDPQELFPYKVIVIAAPKTPFTEFEKFALDQYVMNGGSLFFLIDGVKINEEDFDVLGESVTLKNELNLDDLLFTYGIRVNSTTLMDMNCTSIHLASSQPSTKETFVTLPWYFSPLLEPDSDHIITQNISPLQSELVSTITFVGEGDLKKTTLLTSSSHAHLLPVPERVSLRYVEMPADPSFFNEKYVPVAGLVEGQFNSVFRNRKIPEEVYFSGDFNRLEQSKPARVVVVGNSSVIKNEWRRENGVLSSLPLGYDKITGEQLGNADFIVNTVNYLAGNEDWLKLRSNYNKLRLLDRQQVTQYLLKWQLINTLLPVIIMFMGGMIFFMVRKKRVSIH